MCHDCYITLDSYVFVYKHIILYPNVSLASASEQIVQGRPDRIRMTMFPDDGMEVPSTQMMRNQQTNLQRLSQPAQILKAIISGLATYQVLRIIDVGCSMSTVISIYRVLLK